MTGPTRRIIKKSSIQVGQPTMGTTVGDAPPVPIGPEPTLVLHREGDDIRAIEVTCSCGKTIIIECEYAEEAKS